CHFLLPTVIGYFHYIDIYIFKCFLRFFHIRLYLKGYKTAASFWCARCTQNQKRRPTAAARKQKTAVLAAALSSNNPRPPQ
ncbi:hypothetical protein, partial [Pseudoramibacter alactolyticus]